MGVMARDSSSGFEAAWCALTSGVAAGFLTAAVAAQPPAREASAPRFTAAMPRAYCARLATVSPSGIPFRQPLQYLLLQRRRIRVRVPAR